MGIEKGIFKRMELLVGECVMQKTAAARVIIFGVGGVGSWCAESLVRSGVRHLTIVDSDRVCITNVNRQLMATTKTIGRVKVEVLKERLLEINPTAEIVALQKIYDETTADSFNIGSYDYIIDAIDSLKDKALLILEACKTDSVLLSSMGAALKIDASKIAVAEFWKVKGCPLARALRNKFRKMKVRPAHKFKCVYSDELLHNLGTSFTCGTDQCVCSNKEEVSGDPALADHNWNNSKAQINGTAAHITAIFGFTLASLVVNDLYQKGLAKAKDAE